MSKRRIVITLGAAAALGAAGWGWKRWRGGGEKPPETVKIEKGAVENRFFEAAEVVPEALVSVRSPVSGVLEKVFVKRGDKVKKGQRLAVIQPGRSRAERFQPVDVDAPITGTIVVSYLEEGDSVNQTGESSVIVEITDLASMEIQLSINEIDVFKVKAGMPAKVTLDAVPGETFPGRVKEVSPGVTGKQQKTRSYYGQSNEAVKSFEAIVTLERSDLRFRPGMTARVDLLIAKAEDVPVVPLSAVSEDAGKTFVHVPGAKGPERVEVELGLRSAMNAEVKKGLAPGDEVYRTPPKGGKGARRGAGGGRGGRRGR